MHRAFRTPARNPNPVASQESAVAIPATLEGYYRQTSEDLRPDGSVTQEAIANAGGIAEISCGPPCAAGRGPGGRIHELLWIYRFFRLGDGDGAIGPQGNTGYTEYNGHNGANGYTGYGLTGYTRSEGYKRVSAPARAWRPRIAVTGAGRGVLPLVEGTRNAAAEPVF
jgi:hypothetical protein